MRKRSKLFITIISLLVFSAGIFATFAEPGTQDDPLVSKSYVDAQIASVKSANGSTFAVVYVDAGKKVLGKEGTEIIVRSGEAKAIDNGANGVADLTSGVDLKTGQTAQLDHLLLVPREDGRGILAGTELYIMVRGEYTIQ